MSKFRFQLAVNGWWGENPPFLVPVFVLTHHRRALKKWREARPSSDGIPVRARSGEEGRGRLLDNVGTLQLEQVRAIEAPGVTDIKYRVLEWRRDQGCRATVSSSTDQGIAGV